MFSVMQEALMREYLRQPDQRKGPAGPWVEHLMDDEGLSYEEVRGALIGWELLPYSDPKLGHMATLIKKNKEVHFAIFRRFRHRSHVSTARIAEFLQPILDAETFLVTKIDRPQDAKFIEHLGFQELSVAPDGVRCYILNAIKYPEVRHASPV